MALSTSLLFCILPLSLLLVVKTSADPDALQDFCVADTFSPTVPFNGLFCLYTDQVSAMHFTTSVLSSPGNTSASPMGVMVTATTPKNIPGLNTLGLTMVRIDLAKGAVLSPHTHPRASEMIFVLQGSLNVGFVDTTNKLFSQQIKAGDVFVFPKGTLHFLHNVGSTPASVIAALNSQNPGTFQVSLATFASDPAIPNQVLSSSFLISPKQVNSIRKKLGGR